jgi:hypothetical protein
MIDHIVEPSGPRGRVDIQVGAGRRRRWSDEAKGRMERPGHQSIQPEASRRPSKEASTPPRDGAARLRGIRAGRRSVGLFGGGPGRRLLTHFLMIPFVMAASTSGFDLWGLCPRARRCQNRPGAPTPLRQGACGPFDNAAPHHLGALRSNARFLRAEPVSVQFKPCLCQHNTEIGILRPETDARN